MRVVASDPPILGDTTRARKEKRYGGRSSLVLCCLGFVGFDPHLLRLTDHPHPKRSANLASAGSRSSCRLERGRDRRRAGDSNVRSGRCSGLRGDESTGRVRGRDRSRRVYRPGERHGLVEASRDVNRDARDGARRRTFTLQVAGIQETVTVGALAGYDVPAVSSATKTTTPLRDVPQAVSVVSSALIADQRMASMADVTRYMPGVGIAQGEGNRDTPILRGNSSTSDFFVDGVRDDVQYFRDVYNVDRVEALKGPNAMIFGRGGVGGVINRVTRQADWGQSREVVAAVRLVGQPAVHGRPRPRPQRDGGRPRHRRSTRTRTPTATASASSATASIRRSRSALGSEHDAPRWLRVLPRRAHRGPRHLVVSTAGRSRRIPARSSATRRGATSDATVNVLVVGPRAPRSAPRITLRNRLSYGDYDKFYQNVFPGAVNAAGTTVAISAYNNATDAPESVQPDGPDRLAPDRRIGHTLLLGAEFGRQETDNFRDDRLLHRRRRRT